MIENSLDEESIVDRAERLANHERELEDREATLAEVHQAEAREGRDPHRAAHLRAAQFHREAAELHRQAAQLQQEHANEFRQRDR